VINGVGTWSDMRLEPLLSIDTLLAHLPPQYLIAVDIGLASTPRLIRGLSETELGAIPLAAQSAARTSHHYLAKLRVSAEWGIAGMKLMKNFSAKHSALQRVGHFAHERVCRRSCQARHVHGSVYETA